MNERFEPLCGTGTLRAKPTVYAVIRSGVISLPNIGQCYIDGTHSRIATSTTLDVKRVKGRKLVAKLIVPIGHDAVLEGTVITEPTSRHKSETWKLVAVLRQGEAGPYRALRLPDVKISAEEREAAFGEDQAPRSKYAVA